MVNEILLVINFASFVAIFIVLFHYKRNGARFRPLKSATATIVMLSALWLAGDIAAQAITRVSIPHTILAVTLLCGLIRAKGNIADIFPTSDK